MISYAQNLEDVMLQRALKEVSKGFYIDIGANDPIVDSVTKHFYDSGWSGINIEPLSEHFNELERQRPRDTNLQLAVSNIDGNLKIWQSEVRGWATLDTETAKDQAKNGFKGSWLDVKVTTLKQITEGLNEEVHFLKIDVEGHEEAILAGADFSKFRPWIIVIEATVPGSSVPNFQSWESLLVSANYSCCYFDGINRFYLANEHDRLLDHFTRPPNIFDNYILNREADLENQNKQLLLDIQKREFRIRSLDSELAQLQHQLNSIYSSTSWKLTYPLRIVVDSIRSFLKTKIAE